MRTVAVAATIFLLASISAAPLKEKKATPITPQNLQEVREIGAIQRDAYRFDWIAGSDNLVIMPWEDEIEIFDSLKLSPVQKLAVGKRLVQFGLSSDGKKLAWAENNSTITIEDLRSGKKLTFDTGNSQPTPVFSPDGKWLAIGGGGAKASLWDVATAKKIRDFDSDAEGGLTPCFSPDGKTLAIGNRNSDPRLFETSTGKLLHVLPKKMTQQIRFNPAGTVIATTYVDGSIGLWDVASGKSLQMTKTTGEELYTVDWNPKGDLLVTAGLKAKIIIWDAKELRPLKELDAPEWVIHARFSPDGSRLVTAGGGMLKSPDRQITIWGLPGQR